MDNIYVLRGRLEELYSQNSKIYDKVLQFILAITVFMVINNNVGFMKAAATPVAAMALAVVCTFLPLSVTVVAATALIAAHMYSVSLVILGVTAVIFLIMYIFYLRLSPKMALVVLLTPLAFFLKIPYVIPVACGLTALPGSLAAVICGTVVYYMMEYVKKTAANIEGADIKGMMSQATDYITKVFQNKEMWVVVTAFVICFFIVFAFRRASMDHAWKIAVVAGTIVNMIVIVVGDIALGIHTSYGTLIGGSIASIAVGLVLEIFFFSVDYSRSENLQFEDDEYYYYVKAVPKLSVAKPEKTVKRINERQETEIMNTEVVRRKSGASSKGTAKSSKRPVPKKGQSVKKHDMREIDKMLLTQSLRRDLNLKD